MEQRYKSETEERDVWQEFGQRVRTFEDHRQVSVLVMVLALLRGFLTITAGLRGRTPRAVLAEMDQDRVWAQRFPEVLTEPLCQYWDRQEQELYEHILPQDVRQKAVDSIHCNGQSWETIVRACLETRRENADAVGLARAVVSPEGRRRFQQEYLTQLRAQLTDPRVTPLLEQVIGRAETRGRVKLEGASLKNWPLVGEAIWVVYEILWPIYTQASENQLQSAGSPIQNDPPTYPQSLLDDVATLFRTEFPEYLSDLSSHDVLSRVQYRNQLATNSTQL